MSKAVHSLLAVTLISAAVCAQSAGGWWGDVYDDHPVALEDILERPNSFRGQTVSFVVQIHRLGKVENPFYTRFDKDWYINFSVWSDRAPLWDKSAYKNDFQYLFIKRESKAAKTILKAPTYSRFVVVAEVSAVFKGKPWMEVKGLEGLDKSMNEASLVHMVKGTTLAKVNRHYAAAQEFAAAETDSLPRNTRVLLRTWQARALFAAGKYKPALQSMQAAISLASEATALKAELAGMKKRAAEQPEQTEPAKDSGPGKGEPVSAEQSSKDS